MKSTILIALVSLLSLSPMFAHAGLSPVTDTAKRQAIANAILADESVAKMICRGTSAVGDKTENVDGQYNALENVKEILKSDVNLAVRDVNDIQQPQIVFSADSQGQDKDADRKKNRTWTLHFEMSMMTDASGRALTAVQISSRGVNRWTSNENIGTIANPDYQDIPHEENWDLELLCKVESK